MKANWDAIVPLISSVFRTIPADRSFCRIGSRWTLLHLRSGRLSKDKKKKYIYIYIKLIKKWVKFFKFLLEALSSISVLKKGMASLLIE